jgi:hypothetical protein
MAISVAVGIAESCNLRSLECELQHSLMLKRSIIIKSFYYFCAGRIWSVQGRIPCFSARFSDNSSLI